MGSTGNAISKLLVAPHKANQLISSSVPVQNSDEDDIPRWPIAFPDEIVGRVADRMVSDEDGGMPVVERETRRFDDLTARKDLLRIRHAIGEQEPFLARAAPGRAPMCQIR